MVRTMTRLGAVASLAASLLAAPTLAAQATSTPAAASGPAVGEQAPDFSLAAVSRYGVLRDPVHLADLRGQTVVLAFFYKARTKG